MLSVSQMCVIAIYKEIEDKVLSVSDERRGVT